jgi:hypothetical protein
MKCDRRWWNDGRMELEGEQRSTEWWGVKRGAEPFWMWWTVDAKSQEYRDWRAKVLARSAFSRLFDQDSPNRAGSAVIRRLKLSRPA